MNEHELLMFKVQIFPESHVSMKIFYLELNYQ